ncbi:MAG: hypothetical protein RTU63_05335 [Candidatus Thorarchaeota archaeon]
MIASERAQNTIVVSVIIVALVSSVFLAGNAAYYGGTYTLAGRLDATLMEVRVTNIDHVNESIDPILRLTFNVATTASEEGNVRMTYFGSDVMLNDDALSYMSFSRTLPQAEQYLVPGFDVNITMTDSADSVADKAAFLDADTSDTWNWYIEFYYSFIVFDELGTVTFRTFYFNTTITTIV